MKKIEYLRAYDGSTYYGGEELYDDYVRQRKREERAQPFHVISRGKDWDPLALVSHTHTYTYTHIKPPTHG